jgi:D-tagatose-1,6-bisphosphate aldolase subunit GatZ/KbaZ
MSVCSSHPAVLSTVLSEAASRDIPLLIEATSNQVNPFGGYTGMTPADFTGNVKRLAQEAEIPLARVGIGADHLGPHAWRAEPAEQAMEKATVLVRDCVRAGFIKIHLDAGMRCADDPGPGLDAGISARRAAMLCRAAESVLEEDPANGPPPLYVIGAEVPVPGGGLLDGDCAPVTDPTEVENILELHQEEFRRAGLENAWDRVMAVVVQPGVDFGDASVSPYDPRAAESLSRFHDRLSGIMTYEVHATDYQGPEALACMVRDHFSVLKTGPCLTHAFREAVFGLAHIEWEWLSGRKGIKLSGLRETMAALMANHPEHWQSHYLGSANEQQWLRNFSFRDRIRYYWSNPEAHQALDRLTANLGKSIPFPLLSQYLPGQWAAVRAGEIPASPEALIRHRIRQALSPYIEACRSVSD